MNLNCSGFYVLPFPNLIAESVVEAMGYVAWLSTVLLLAQNLVVLRGAQGSLQSVWSNAGRRLGNNLEAPG